ncbi:MAG: glycosyltransferase [Prevotellaceae bacterium]|jgi:cellulose synthase/poly-beta-1,6-N-acetylglucosamine synthase-like glycosyltransferase|nr:glycosyltransferase [Prevotellaceae bacterium]
MLILYTILVFICLFFWLKTKAFSPKNSAKPVSLSAVVCCKNEEENLPLLLSSIATQIADIEQIIFANDNSTDKTLEILQEFSTKFSNVKIFSTTNFGKKNALKEAMQFAKNEFVVCFDADCILPKNYFAIIKSFLQENQPDLVIGGVKYSLPTTHYSLLTTHYSLLSKIQSLEFASLQVFGAGAALAKMPIMCNGANLAFRREIWQEAENHLVESEISGDDVFLLHYVKKIGGKILFLKSAENFVETFPAKNLKQFFRQRQRWASKSTSYTDWQTIFTAFIVFLLNFEILFSLVAAFFLPFFKIYFLIIFLSKILIDSLLLIPFLKFSKQKNLIKYIPFLSIFYPFYIVFTTFWGIFGKARWK